MMPLAMAKEGSHVCIHQVNCHTTLCKRLSEMGLYDKTIITVVRNSISGPLIIEAKKSKLVIGRGEALKIIVKEE